MEASLTNWKMTKMTDNPPMANPITQEVCYYNEPHAWTTHMGSHLPPVQICMSCQTVNRKDIQVQIDEAKAEGYESGWRAGHSRGRGDGFRAGEERGINTVKNLARESIEQIRQEGHQAAAQAYKEGEKLGLQMGLERGAAVANQANEYAIASNEAQATNQSAPSAPQASHKCAHSMLLAMHDGTDMVIPFSHKLAQRGWKVRKMNGVDVLVIGHGVPRRTIPLCNVKFFDLLTEDDL